MNLTYLEHSGFFLELEQLCLLFDYWKGQLPPPIAGKKLLVFASHAHHDHFSRDIFAYGSRWESVHYVFGKDIRLSTKLRAHLGIRPGTSSRMGPDQQAEFFGAAVRTLRSTDAGVAFLVEAEGRTIYHAGDLNWWVWEGEPEMDNAAMTTAFLREMDKLKGVSIDLAFLTLDGRQEAFRFRGFDYCLRNLSIARAVPMHSFGDYGPHNELLTTPLSRPYREKLLLMTEPGMTVTLP